MISYPETAHVETREIEETSFWYRHRNAMLLAIANKFLDKNDLIYDIGGGNGIVSKILIVNGFNCIVVEAMPGALNFSGQRNIPTIASDISGFNGVIHVALLIDVLEHIEDDFSILRKIYDQMAPGGILILTVPAFQHLVTDVDKEIGHYKRYSLKQIKTKAAAAGFKNMYVSYFFSLLYFPMLFLRVLPYRLGVMKAKKANRRKREHLADHPFLNKMASAFLGWECSFIKNNFCIPFGTSCLIVAKKPVK